MKDVVLQKYRVANTFREDYKGKGQYGEEDFITFFHSRPKNKNKTLFDVRHIPYYQKNDIDFVIDNMGGECLPSVETVFNEKERYIKIEVKFNTPALKTGNIAFETVSHGRKGWGEISKCDYVYFVFGEEVDKNKFITKKRGIIKFKEWYDYIKQKETPKKRFVNVEENIVDILVKIEELEKRNIFHFF